MSISRDRPSKTLEEIMAELGDGQPLENLGNAQVLPPPGQILDENDGDGDWVDLTITPPSH